MVVQDLKGGVGEEGRRLANEQKSNEAQTDIINTSDLETQQPERNSVEVQTDKTNADEEYGHYDPNAVAEFMKNKLSTMIAELEKNEKSHAFDNYHLLNNDDDLNYNVTLMKKFRPAAVPSSEEFQVTSLSWNCTGAVIAAGYGAMQHEEWCEHDNVKICCWNVDRFKDADKPHAIIELETCVTCIAYHPTLPSVLAVGDFGGRVMLYNTSDEDLDAMIGSSGVTDEDTIGHREPITALLWIRHREKSSSQDYQIISGSLDGKILIWNINTKEQLLEVQEGFLILGQNLPTLTKSGTRSGREIGVTSLSQNCEDPSILIASTQDGGLYQCNLDSHSIANATMSSVITFKNPVVFAYSGHNSHTCSSEFSEVRNAFLSSGYDGKIALFSLLHTKPVVVIQHDVAITGANWSPVRPLVFAVSTYDGKIMFYDLDESQTSAVAEVPVVDDTSRRKCKPMTCLQFNVNDPKVIASGDEDGNLFIWKLSNRFASKGVQERETLLQLTNVKHD